jgi:hypothetical protein
MRETEIRAILTHVCKELDTRARRSAGAAVLGASLLVTAGCSDDPGLNQDGDAAVDGGTGQPDGGAVPAYMAPQDSGTPSDSGNGDIDSGAVAEYAAPDPDAAVDAGAMPHYMVQPVDAGTEDASEPVDAGTEDASEPVDAGVAPAYMAPYDSGPLPPYMVQPVEDAGTPIDAGPMPEYMAQPVEDAATPIDAGPTPKYMVQPVEDAGQETLDADVISPLYMAVEVTK